MADLSLEVENLTKDFKSFRAVDRVSFTVPKGKVIGLLGPNGAGKTTTIQMLLGITTPTSGTIKYFGKDFTKNKSDILKKINFTSAYSMLLGRLSAYENLMVYSNLYQIKNAKQKILEYAKYFEIDDFLYDKVVWNLSSGQRTRVNLVKSLLNEPELILMDEPTASLDPDIADKTLSVIEKLRDEKGISILYTSHDMDEVTRVCDEVIFLHQGKIVVRDTPINLAKKVSSIKLKLIFDCEREKIVKALDKLDKKYTFDRKIVYIDTEEKEIAPLISNLTASGVQIADIEVIKPTLEDVFIQIARGGDYVI